MTKVGYGNLTVNEGRQWEESGRFRENCVTSLLYDPLISDGRSGSRCPRMSPYRVGLIKRISGQTGMSLYGFVAPAVAVRRHTRTLSRGATWRYTVGRPAASVSDVEALQ